MQSRFIQSLVAAIAVAAIPPTGAVASQDLRSPDARDATTAVTRETPSYSPRDLRSPDTRDAASRAAPETPSSTPRDLRSPDVRDAARGVTRVTSPVEISAPPDSGWFNWASAGIGAGALALLLIAAAGMTTRARHMRGHVAT